MPSANAVFAKRAISALPTTAVGQYRLEVDSLSGEPPVEVVRSLGKRLFGVHLKDFAEQADKTKGVIVTDVEKGSPAQQRGLRKDDRIVAVNRKSVNTVEEFKSALKDSGRQSALFVKRGDEDLLIVVQ